MPDDSKNIFVTYRRALSTDFVHRLRDHLKARGFDVFVDVQSIPSGKFADTILHQIEARPHFLAVLVPGCLERTTSEDDWYRREVEHALKTRRNIIPLLAKGFSFAEEHGLLRRNSLPGRLDELKQYQHFSFIYEYDEQFQANIDVLTKRFLVIPEETRIIPTPRKERETVREMLKVADLAKADQSGSDWILPLQSRFLFMPLPAPSLAAAEGGKLKWTGVADASGYVLQSSWDAAFSKPDELYAGEQTEFVQPLALTGAKSFGLARSANPLAADQTPMGSIASSLFGSPLLATRYYRVKARGGLGRLDSAWSNVVKIEPPPVPLPAPILVQSSIQLFSNKFSWTAVAGAVGYTLQTSEDAIFSKPEEVYSGEETSFAHDFGLFGHLRVRQPFGAGLFGGAPPGTRYYRVKARAGPGRLDSPWSNVVEVEPPKPLPAPELEKPSVQAWGRKLTWTAVDGAVAYLLQKSSDEAFSKPEDLYTGPETEFVEGGGDLPWLDVASARGGPRLGVATNKPAFGLSSLLAEFGPRYYRVRAKAGLDRPNSPWSNVVSTD